jgi:hypothetical protein
MERDGTGGQYRADVLVIGGGVAGLVTALELLEGGRSVVVVDRDTRERLGGLARWAFGGMALVGTPEQRRLKIDDSPARALEDWIRFGELGPEDHWPRAWAELYVNESRTEIYDWLRRLGLKFMPAVNWVERGSAIEGNTAARYHILWGTGLGLVKTVIARLRKHKKAKRLILLHRHRVDALETSGSEVRGARGVDEASGREYVVEADRTVIATGGINGAVEQVRRHWPPHWPRPPGIILNGAHPFSDGALHARAAELGGALASLTSMWNYAAGIPHPQPHFEGHGLSLVPPKSVLWLDPDGLPVGPAPMVTGYDTRELCRQVALHPYTWMVLNWKIAAKELAISGSEHNPRIVKRQLLRFLWDLLRENDRLVRRMAEESIEFLVASTAEELAGAMNRLTEDTRVQPGALAWRIAMHDRMLSDPAACAADPAQQRIQRLREWRGDRLRTCDRQPIGDPKAGPLLAIRLHFISRKSLGGLVTDLEGRVLRDDGSPVPGLYAVGEAAGFGGGGASGKRSLEGTFLSGCILTARKAAAGML